MSWRSGQAYAQDLRDRVLSSSGSIHQIALRFEVSESYVCRVRAKYRRQGETTPGVQCGHRPRRLAGHEQALKDRVAMQADQTVDDLRTWLATEHGIALCRTTLWKAMKRLGLTFKKRPSAPVSRLELR